MSEHLRELIVVVGQCLIVSLSGVISPGAMTAAALAAGTRSRHAGALMAVGHGIVEFPLMALILLGAGKLFEAAAFHITVGLAGGAMLLVMAVGMFRSLRRADAPAAQPPRRGPVLTGIVLSAGNPMFLIWWATVGLTLATRATRLGVGAFAIFAVLHWLCDFLYLEAMTWVTFKGSRLMGPKVQRAILAVCAAALAYLGVSFAVDAVVRIFYF